MTTADEAWEAWLNNPREQSFYSTEDVFKAGFAVGVTAGLEDAADDPFLRVKFIDSWGNVRQWLRDRARATSTATDTGSER